MEAVDGRLSGYNLSEAQADEVREVLYRFALAEKNINLYPEGHSVSRKSLYDLQQALSSYTARYGELILEVLEDGFRHGEQTYARIAGIQDIAHICHRDGIEWLVFLEGLPLEEVSTFLKILNANRNIGDESEGDIVTALWDAQLSFIQYHTSKELWGSEQLADLERIQVGERSSQPQGEPASTTSEEQEQSALEPSFQRLWQLAPEELERTREMVYEEETRDLERDVFEVLLVILTEQEEREDFAVALEIIRESFVRALSKGQFQHACRFLTRFHELREQYRLSGHWALSYLEDFLLIISGSPVLSSLEKHLKQPREMEQSQLESLQHLLSHLHPESIEPLLSQLTAVKSREVASSLSRAIIRLGKRDSRPLRRLARSNNPHVAARSIAILSRMPEKRAENVFWEATRSSSPTVRKAGVRALISVGTADYESLLPFLNDSEDKIRNYVFRFLVQRPSPELEETIVRQLQRSDFSRRDAGFLIQLYRVLGSCASSQTISFLKRMLFARPLSFSGLRAAHRTGAAVALALMNHSETARLLSKASKSIWPAIRRAARKAQEASDVV